MLEDIYAAHQIHEIDYRYKQKCCFRKGIRKRVAELPEVTVTTYQIGPKAPPNTLLATAFIEKETPPVLPLAFTDTPLIKNCKLL